MTKIRLEDYQYNDLIEEKLFINKYDLDFNYDEENDCCYIPEGWWEYRHYNPDDVYNNTIDDEVTHWMPLPEIPEED